MFSRSKLKRGAYLIGLVYFFGLILAGFSLVWKVLFRDELPSMTGWQWVLAPLAIGTFAMCGEWLVQKLQDRMGFGEYGEHKLKRIIHFAIFVVVLAALIIGPVLFQLANP